jgi:pimeloyl-ACP methyl ester carboxylesterase
MQIAVHRLPGLVLSELEFRVPLDYSQLGSQEISVFARSVMAPGKEDAHRPWLVFLQGGPGNPAPRPDSQSGWLKRALKEYHVLLLDQRGTGRSTPITHQTLARLPGPTAQAEYIRQFRADNIVRDAEFIRREMLGEDSKWSVLGQSFGGFCAVRYLAAAPDGLREAFIAGGLPPLERTADDIYRATYRRVAARNERYYERYPADAKLALAIVAHLSSQSVELPGGGILSPRRFQQIGMAFGMSNGFEQAHYLLENAFVQGAGGAELSYVFLRGIENQSLFEANPLYALLHEAEYCQEEASGWSAERIRAEYPEFALADDRPVYFTGEMVYPWMFDEYVYLRPMKGAAELLASFSGWPRLYDTAALERNRVLCAAAVYYDDMYVEESFSADTARHIRGLRAWVTNEYDHNGLRADGERLLDRLIRMARGEA